MLPSLPQINCCIKFVVDAFVLCVYITLAYDSILSMALTVTLINKRKKFIALSGEKPPVILLIKKHTENFHINKRIKWNNIKTIRPRRNE